MFVALEVWKSWKSAQSFRFENSSNPSHVSVQRWSAPPVGMLKCNVDVAFLPSYQQTGLGMILWNVEGQFVACATTIFNSLTEVREGEALGLHEALSWVKRLGYQQVVFELDAKSVVDAVNSDLHMSDVSEFGSIIQ